MRKKTSKKDEGVSLKHKNGDYIEFIDEADRHKFCDCIVSKLKNKDIQKKIIEKEAKCKASFKIDVSIPELSSMGIDPDLVFKFKKVKRSDEWDLDIEMNKKETVDIEEYFEVIPKNSK